MILNSIKNQNYTGDIHNEDKQKPATAQTEEPIELDLMNTN